MKLEQTFYRLPLKFDAARMAEEAAQFSEAQWRAHPSSYEGNTALILVSANGGQNDDLSGPMLPTDLLKHCPYIRQVLASFGTIIGRSRLMRLAPGAVVKPHSDVNYYWRNHLRIHIPITTDPAVAFTSNNHTVHMAAGEAWTFDNWQMHTVVNPSEIQRIHLVADTVGTAAFWKMLRDPDRVGKTRFVEYRPDVDAGFVTEHYSPPPLLSPAELEICLRELAEDVREYPDLKALEALRNLSEDLRREWRAIWVVHGTHQSGWPAYRKAVNLAKRRMKALPTDMRVASNGLHVQGVLGPILMAAFDANTAEITPTPAPAAPRSRPADATATAQPAKRSKPPAFDRPVFIIAAPRSGSTLLFETLATNLAFMTVGDESHKHFEGIPALHPSAHGFDSNRLTETDASPKVTAALRQALRGDLRGAKGLRFAEMPPAERPAKFRFLEKTPKNALRIPFLQAVFPDARFIYLYRNARDNISSLLDSWRSERYVTYPNLPGWTGHKWSHLLIPGWRDLIGAPLAEIVKQQWCVTNQIILDDLEKLPEPQWCAVSYEELLADPAATLQRLCEFADTPFGQRMRELVQAPLKPSRYTLSQPDPDKWRKNAAELEGILPQVSDMDARLRGLSS